MLRELTSLSLNINNDTLILSSVSEADLVTGGPAYKLSPSLLLGSHIWTMGELVMTVLIFMDSRFRYEVSHVVMNCRDPQESLRALRALGACREHGEACETSTCCCMYLSDFPILHCCLLGPIFNRPFCALPLLNK